jgi:hypothetical protein
MIRSVNGSEWPLPAVFLVAVLSGFALYAWVTCFRRFVLGSLNHHLLVGMVNRMVVVGSMIGSGIFIVSANIARQVGSAGWLLAAWVVSGLLVMAVGGSTNLLLHIPAIAHAAGLRRPFHDPMSGMYAVGAAATELLSRPYTSEAPEVEALLRVTEAGLRLEEVPVHMRPRQHGESKLQGRKALGIVVTVAATLLLGRRILKRRG